MNQLPAVGASSLSKEPCTKRAVRRAQGPAQPASPTEPRGALLDSRGLSFGPRLLVTSSRSGLERSRKREPPGAEPARGLCAGDRRPDTDRDPGPRSLARGSPHQPSGNPDRTRIRGLVDQGGCAKLAAASASAAPRAGGTGRFRRGRLQAHLQSCIMMPRPGHARSRPRASCPAPPWCQRRCLGLVVTVVIVA
jgi:hypothetical protein